MGVCCALCISVCVERVCVVFVHISVRSFRSLFRFVVQILVRQPFRYLMLTKSHSKWVYHNIIHVSPTSQLHESGYK